VDVERKDEVPAGLAVGTSALELVLHPAGRQNPGRRPSDLLHNPAVF
jgi:hypothetical protein